MGSQLSLSVVEITILMLGAIVLGFTIHFFVFSRRSWREMNEVLENKKNPSYAPTSANKLEVELASWKSKFFDESDLKNKLVDDLKKQLAEAEENLEIYTIEAEETKIKNKKLKAELEELKINPPQSKQQDYLVEIKQAEQSLLQQNERIAKLLGQIDVVKESESKNSEILQENEDLKSKLSIKEKEILSLRQKENLSKEMTSMLDNAYAEFNILQQKIKSLEEQLAASKKVSINHDDLQEGQLKLNRDIEDLKQKYQSAQSENRELRTALTEAQEKLSDTEFQRQLLQRKVAFLENLNTDMDAIADSHKKLEAQIKKMGELESKLSLVSEERDKLAQQKLKSV
jgi:chromosome segregation ATPase